MRNLSPLSGAHIVRISAAVFLLTALPRRSEPYSLLWGSLGFALPRSWEETDRRDSDTVSVVSWSVPGPGATTLPPSGTARLSAYLTSSRPDIATFGNRQVTEMSNATGSPRLLGDSMVSGDSLREVRSLITLNGVLHEVRQILAVRDSILLNLVITLPVGYSSDTVWAHRHQTNVDTLLHSMCIGTKHVLLHTSLDCVNIFRVLPFTYDENSDGARFAWFMARRARVFYPYVPTASLPTSPTVCEIPRDSARDGDFAWWPKYLVIYDKSTDGHPTDQGRFSLDELITEFGPVRFFRPLVIQRDPPPPPPTGKATITGRVLDSLTAKPLLQARVCTTRDNDSTQYCVNTNTLGSFRIDSLPLGSWTLRVTCDVISSNSQLLIATYPIGLRSPGLHNFLTFLIPSAGCDLRRY